VVTNLQAPEEDVDTVHEIARLLFQVTEQTRHHFESAARRLDLTASQARTLLELESPSSMRLLADRLHCDASNITGLADRLEARGLVVRQPDRADRRIKTLVLTADGRRARAELEDAVRNSPVMAGLTAAERTTLHGLLVKAAEAGGAGCCPSR